MLLKLMMIVIIATTVIRHCFLPNLFIFLTSYCPQKRAGGRAYASAVSNLAASYLGSVGVDTLIPRSVNPGGWVGGQGGAG